MEILFGMDRNIVPKCFLFRVVKSQDYKGYKDLVKFTANLSLYHTLHDYYKSIIDYISTKISGMFELVTLYIHTMQNFFVGQAF